MHTNICFTCFQKKELELYTIKVLYHKKLYFQKVLKTSSPRKSYFLTAIEYFKEEFPNNKVSID